MTLPLLLLLSLLLSASPLAFGPAPTRTLSSPPSARRAFLSLPLLPLLAPLPSFAATSPPTPAELARLKKGVESLDYLVKNWDAETTVCRENGGECKRDAEPVRRYLGLRSTTDPLFQIEKVFDKVKYMDGVGDLDEFFAAQEDFTAAITMSNSMAFISQFGEYNPGGGADQVLKYLNESKENVVKVQTALKKMIEVMGI